jgi:hypothetical protein
MSQFAFPKLRMLEQAASPSIPSGEGGLFVKADGFLYFRNDIGEEVQITNENGVVGGGGSGSAAPQDYQFSPGQLVAEYGAALTNREFNSGPTEVRLFTDSGTDAAWTPWIKIPKDWESRVAGGKSLVLDLGMHCNAGAWFPLGVQAELWVDDGGGPTGGSSTIVLGGADVNLSGYFENDQYNAKAGQTEGDHDAEGVIVSGPVEIDQGSEINSATLRFTSTTETGLQPFPLDVTVYGVDEDNCDKRNTGIQTPEQYILAIENGNLTTATSTYQSPASNNPNPSVALDVTNILQEIVNRAGWQRGNTVGFFFQTESYNSFGGSTVLQLGNSAVSSHDLTVNYANGSEQVFNFGFPAPNPRASAKIGFDWTPGAGDFAAANETWVRFRMRRIGGQGTSQPAFLLRSRVAIDTPDDEYGYGY